MSFSSCRVMSCFQTATIDWLNKRKLSWGNVGRFNRFLYDEVVCSSVIQGEAMICARFNSVQNTLSSDLMTDLMPTWTVRFEVRQSLLAHKYTFPLSHFTKLVPLYPTNPGNALPPRFLKAIFLDYHEMSGNITMYSECWQLRCKEGGSLDTVDKSKKRKPGKVLKRIRLRSHACSWLRCRCSLAQAWPVQWSEENEKFRKDFSYETKWGY